MSKLQNIIPEYRRINMTSIKGVRTHNTVTFNPNKANPGEEVYVNVPQLRPSVCLIPNTLFLSAKFKSSNTKSCFMNNLGRLLVKKLEVTVGGEVVYDNTNESVYEVYRDLWLSDNERSNMIEVGVMNENLRKLMSGDDSGNKREVGDKMMSDILDSRIRIKLGKILNDHGLYAPYDMGSDIRYKITLPSSDEVLVPQTGQSIGEYSLEDIKLEFETLENTDVYKEAITSYEVGRTLSYEHITMFKRELWEGKTTLINENINLPRKSMKAIVMLFTPKVVKDSEEFIFPLIQKVKITIEGTPNSVFSQGMDWSYFYHEADRVFQSGDRDTLLIDKFYNDKKFGLAIDLRSFSDNDVAGDGRKILNTQSGVLLEITKKSGGDDVYCHTYVVSDGLINFSNLSLQSIEY